MPARTRKRRVKKPSKSIRLYFYVLVVFVFILLLFFWIRSSKIWNGKEMLALAYPNNDQVSILILNPEREEMYKINIPNNTQVNVVGNRGEWKLGALWRLGIDQRQSGLLLTQTIVKNFFIPVYAWGGSQLDGLYSGNLLNNLKLIFFAGKTNLGYIERFKLIKLALSIKEIDKYQMNIQDTGFVKQLILKDGTYGYKLTSVFPNKLLPWVSVYLTNDALNLSIYNVSGEDYNLDPLAKAIETMGVKVISKSMDYDKYESDTDCVVEGDQKESIIIAKIFSCQYNNKTMTSGSDLNLVIGKQFIERF